MARTFTGSTSGLVIGGNNIPASSEYSTFGIFYCTTLSSTSYVLSGAGDYHGLRLTPTTMTYKYGGGNTATPSSAMLISTNTWYFVVVTKATGNVAHRFHLYNYATNTWTHTNESAVTNQSSASVTDMYLGRWYMDTSVSFTGDIHLAGHVNKNLTDDQVLGMAHNLSYIYNLAPEALYVLDQSATTQAARNIFDGGQQSTLTGTSVASRSIPGITYGHPVLYSAAYASGITQTGDGSSSIVVDGTATQVVLRPGAGTSNVTVNGAAESAVLRPGTGTSNIAVSSSTVAAVLRPGAGTGTMAVSSVTSSGALRPSTGTSNITVTGSGDVSGAQVGSGTSTGTVTSNTQAGVIRPGTATGSITATSNGSGSIVRVGSGSSTISVTGTVASARVVTGTGSSSIVVSGSGDVSGTQTSTGTGSVASTSTATPVVLRPGSGTSTMTVTGTAEGNVIPAVINAGEGTSAISMTGSATAVRITSAASSSTSTVTGEAEGTRELVSEGSSESTFTSDTEQTQILADESISGMEMGSSTLSAATYLVTGSGHITMTGATAARVIKQILLQYPDVEAKMAIALSEFVPAGRVGTELPVDLAQKLPFIRVTRRGGGDDGVTDRARMDIEVFAATRAVGYALIEKIRQHLIQSSAYRAGDPFDFVTCDVGPQELPWGDGRTVRRWTTSYSVRSRRARY